MLQRHAVAHRSQTRRRMVTVRIPCIVTVGMARVIRAKLDGEFSVASGPGGHVCVMDPRSAPEQRSESQGGARSPPAGMMCSFQSSRKPRYSAGGLHSWPTQPLAPGQNFILPRDARWLLQRCSTCDGSPGNTVPCPSSLEATSYRQDGSGIPVPRDTAAQGALSPRQSRWRRRFHRGHAFGSGGLAGC